MINKKTTYKCHRCGRDKFNQKLPHRCSKGFRKKNIFWEKLING